MRECPPRSSHASAQLVTDSFSLAPKFPNCIGASSPYKRFTNFRKESEVQALTRLSFSSDLLIESGRSISSAFACHFDFPQLQVEGVMDDLMILWQTLYAVRHSP